MKKLLKRLQAAVAASLLTLGFGQALAQAGSPSDPFVGYALVHFTGESAHGEQTYMATSTDGLHWTDLNNSQPILTSTVGEKGVRDHSILRSYDGSKYWILASDLRMASGESWNTARHAGSTKLVVWESTDLVHWSAPRLADVAGSIPGAGCAWAPEAIWDPASNAYVVYWTTYSPLNGVNKSRIFYAKTTDFVTFTAPEVYIDRPGKQDIRDTQILEIEGSMGGYRYVRASDDGQLSFEGSQSVLGKWTRIGDLASVGLTGRMVEGPILYQFNDVAKWGQLVDNPGDKGYFPLTSINVADAHNWQIVPSNAYNMGADRKRHGGILNLTASELNRLTTQWGGSTPISRLQSSNFPDRYVRHANFVGRIDQNVSPLDDSRFRMVKGLAGNADYVSFASVNEPGYYLRHKNYELVLEPYDGSPRFAADASFKKVPGLADSTASSFQAYTNPGMYVRHYHYVLRIDPLTAKFNRSDATFRVTD